MNPFFVYLRRSAPSPPLVRRLASAISNNEPNKRSREHSLDAENVPKDAYNDF